MTARLTCILSLIFSAVSCSSQTGIIHIPKDYSVRSALVYREGVVFQDAKANRILYADKKSLSPIIEPSHTVLDFDIRAETLVYLAKSVDTVMVSRFNLAKRSTIGSSKIIVSGIVGFPMIADTLVVISLKDSTLFVSTATNQVVHFIPQASVGSLHEFGFSKDGSLCLLTDVADAPMLRTFGSGDNQVIGPFQYTAHSEYFSACLLGKKVVFSDISNDSTMVYVFTADDLNGLNFIKIRGKYSLLHATERELLFYSLGTFKQYPYTLKR